MSWSPAFPQAHHVPASTTCYLPSTPHRAERVRIIDGMKVFFWRGRWRRWDAR